MEYKPRKASKKFLDSDCPSHVLAIYDNPKFGDRYTILYSDVWEYDGVYYVNAIGCSANPFDPAGIGMHLEMNMWDAMAYRRSNYRHSCKWSDLPDDVKRCVILDAP